MTSNQPEWVIQLEGHAYDLETLAAALKGGRMRVRRCDDSSWALGSDAFRDLTDASEVRARSEDLIQRLNGLGPLADPSFRPLKAGHVYRLWPDGRRDAFVVVSEAIGVRDRVMAVGVSNGGEPAATTPTYLEKAALVAETDAGLAQALIYYGSTPRSFYDLYKVFELSSRHPDHAQWTLGRNRRRFKHSANSPAAVGSEARHATESTLPPANPMSLDEATAFIGEIVRGWVESLWDSAGHGAVPPAEPNPESRSEGRAE